MHTASMHGRVGMPAHKGLASGCPAAASSQRPVAAPQRRGVAARAIKPKVGFKFDKTMQRWVRDDRYADAVANMDDAMTIVTPKTGVPYTIWPIIHTELNAAGIRGVTPEEAFKMQKKGWTIVDVRITGDYAKMHAEGSINIPLYRIVQGTAFWDQVKKVVMAGLAMAATERDPEYVQTALKKLKKGQKIIVACAIGGSLDTKLRLRPDKYPDGINDLDRSFGRESRSLKACHELLKGGWNSGNMVYLDGGFQQWRYQDFPLESGFDEEEN